MPPGERATPPLFRNEDGTPVRTSQLRGMVKLLMSRQGLPETLFGAHSLRIGGATAALSARVSAHVMSQLGNHDLRRLEGDTLVPFSHM